MPQSRLSQTQILKSDSYLKQVIHKQISAQRIISCLREDNFFFIIKRKLIMTSYRYLQVFAALAIVLQCTLGITIKPRSAWGADAARSPSRISGKVDYVIIHHSDNPSGCTTPTTCQRLIKNIQTDHKQRRSFSDIGYNFIIGGDGNVYEGRGFGLQGSHAPGYNRNSIGIVFLGNFENTAPSSAMLQNAKDLIAEAVQKGYLKDNYKLLGHRQTKATACPGTALYNEIKTWPQWTSI